MLFPGNDHINQLTVILDVLGTPGKALIKKCCPRAQRFLSSLPLKERRDLSEYLQPSNASVGFVAFLEGILVIDPSERISAPGRDSHMKAAGMLVRNFELYP